MIQALDDPWLWAAAGLAVALGALALIRWRYSVVTVRGPSMEPALRDGDRLLARRCRAGRLRHGQLVIFREPGRPGGPGRPAWMTGAGQDLWVIKRVAATEGEPVPDAVLAAVRGIAVVPPRAVVVLGDMPASRDSRLWGFIAAREVLGVGVRRLTTQQPGRRLSSKSARLSRKPPENLYRGERGCSWVPEVAVTAQVLVKVLGPIEVSAGERAVKLAGQKQRALLAALALDFGKAVPVARLIDVLWDSAPPANARAKIHDQISALRRALTQRGPDHCGLLVTQPPGYLLNPQRVTLDLTEFTGLTGRARSVSASGQWAAASELLAAALGLWRGTAFADVISARISAAAAALEERRLLAVEAKAEADLACGQYEIVTSELAIWLLSHPLRERLRALMMAGFYGLGCRAEALALYRAGRQIMVEELGLEPGSQLTGLHERILASDHPSQLHPGGGRPHAAGTFPPVVPAKEAMGARITGVNGQAPSRRP